MDKKEFIFPGIVLGIVLIIALGLLLTHGRQTTPPVGSLTASSTATTTAASSTSSSNGSSAPGTSRNYYTYGTTVLALDQVAGFKSGLSIRPLAVLEDSRCPAGVQCIQAGTVKISLRSSMNNQSTTRTLALGDTFSAGGDTVRFVSVEPMRSADAAPASGAYRFTFSVQPGTTASGSMGTGSAPSGPCYVGGCSSEICSDTYGRVSTCMYRPEYSCYKGVKCERQQNGQCGWTGSAELSRCLANPPTE